MPSIINATTSTGLVQTADNSGSLQLQTNNGTTAVTIDTSQNVGIGTSSPSQRLTVAGSTSLGTSSSSGNTSIFQAPGSLYLTLNTNGTLSGARRNWAISPEYDVAGALSFTVGASEGASPSSTQAIITSGGDFRFNSGYGSVATAYGCRAWVNFNGTGTVAIRGSGNVTSITDNGVGNYTVNFTNALPDTNYCPVAMTSGDADLPVLGTSRTVYPISSASSCPVRNFRTVDNSLQDQATLCVAFFR